MYKLKGLSYRKNTTMEVFDWSCFPEKAQLPTSECPPNAHGQLLINKKKSGTNIKREEKSKPFITIETKIGADTLSQCPSYAVRLWFCLFKFVLKVQWQKLEAKMLISGCFWEKLVKKHNTCNGYTRNFFTMMQEIIHDT